MKPEDIIKAAREKKLYTQTEMADRLSKRLNQTYSLRQYQRLEDGEFPKFKKEVVKALDDILGTKTYDIIYDSYHPDEEHASPTIEEPEASAIQKILASSEPFKAISVLAESNSRLADSNKIIADSGKIIAEANYKLVSSNEELVQMTKRIIADAKKEIHPDDHSNFDKVLELLILVGTGTRWKTREEAVSVLNSVLYGPPKTQKEKGIQKGLGK